MANYNGPLEAVDCHIHSVRYDSLMLFLFSRRSYLLLISSGAIPERSACEICRGVIREQNYAVAGKWGRYLFNPATTSHTHGTAYSYSLRNNEQRSEVFWPMLRLIC